MIYIKYTIYINVIIESIYQNISYLYILWDKEHIKGFSDSQIILYILFMCILYSTKALKFINLLILLITMLEKVGVILSSFITMIFITILIIAIFLGIGFIMIPIGIIIICCTLLGIMVYLITYPFEYFKKR